MRKIFAAVLLLAAPIVAYANDAKGETTAADNPSGEWMGTLEVGSIELRLVLRTETDSDGNLSAVLDSVDQGTVIPVSSIELNAETLDFKVASIGASFNGVLDAEGRVAEGTWKQGGSAFPLTLERSNETFVLNRPQNPKAPFPYESRSVRFENTADGVSLGATLITPQGEGPFPTVVFVTGSGAQDRDEALMGHKPFLVIADYLGRHGVASLRYDDRGVGESTGVFLESTMQDFAEDIIAAVAFLTGQPQVDKTAIGVIGHSEGGLTGPLAASQNEEIDFLVLIAPPGEPLGDLIARQTRDLYKVQGVENALIDRALAGGAEDLALLADKSLDQNELIAKLKAKAIEEMKSFTESEREQLGFSEQAIDQGIRQVTTPYFRSLLTQDPATYLKRVKVPVLALFGEKDLQVAASINSKALVAGLKKAGNKDVKVHTFDGLNHLFQHSDTGSPSEYGVIEETFAPEALEMIGEWILARVSVKAAE